MYLKQCKYLCLKKNNKNYGTIHSKLSAKATSGGITGGECGFYFVYFCTT